MKTILKRSLNKEGKEAKKALTERGIKFSEILSNDSSRSPSLLVENELFTYHGLKAIRQYIER
mgnify:CR=1 FL=1